MATTTEDRKLSDMTVGELKSLIRETLSELLDPDYGLELRPEIEERLGESMKQKDRGIPFEEAKKRFGLK